MATEWGIWKSGRGRLREMDSKGSFRELGKGSFRETDLKGSCREMEKGSFPESGSGRIREAGWRHTPRQRRLERWVGTEYRRWDV